MRFKLVGSAKRAKKDKAITFGYKLFETNSKRELIEYVNTHAIIPAIVKGGKRHRKELKEILPIIRLDLDKKGEEKIVDKALKAKGLEYIKKPSTSNMLGSTGYKWHYIIFMDKVPEKYDDYKSAYEWFVNDYLHINIKDNGVKSPTTNMNFNPAGIERTEYHKGKRLDLSHIKYTPKKKRNKNEKYGDVSLKRIKEVLKDINPKDYRDRSEWMKIIASIHHGGGDKAKKLAKQWSKRDKKKYTKEGFDEIWSQLASGRYGDEITVGTLFQMAGWVKDDPVELFPNTGKKLKVKKKKKKKLKTLLDPPNKLDIEFERNKRKSRSLNKMIKEGKLLMVVGDAGSGKTTLTAWMGAGILSEYDEKVLHYWAFDPDDMHKIGMQQYFINKSIGDRAMILDSTVDDMFDYYDGFFEHTNAPQQALADAIIVIDTYKKIAIDVNNKALNAKMMSWGKKLTQYGATVLFLGHTNKDGITHSGTAELEQDSDAIFRIKREKGDGEATFTIEAAGRIRYKFNTISFKTELKGDDDSFHTNAMEKMVEIETDKYSSMFNAVDGETTSSEAKKKRIQDDIASLTKYQRDITAIYDAIKVANNTKGLQSNQEVIARIAGETAPSSNSTLKRLIKRFTHTGSDDFTGLWTIKTKRKKHRRLTIIKVVKKSKLDKHIRDILF